MQQYKRDLQFRKNADRAVAEALVRGIYTMTTNASSLTDESVTENVAACYAAIDEAGATGILSVATSEPRTKVLPRNTMLVIIYNKHLRNPYLDYGFRHKTIIVRDTARLSEQTTQLIYDAMRVREDLTDVIIHVCATKQFGKRKFLIVLCRGKDEYRRAFFKDGRKVPLHPDKVPEERSGELKDRYMLKCLLEHGNTVVDPRFIKRMGSGRTEVWLSTHLGERVYLRKVEDDHPEGDFYVAETQRVRRYNEWDDSEI